MAVLGAGSGTSYPASIDSYQTFTNGAAPATDDSTRIDAELVMDVLKAVVDGIETELGTDPAGSYSDVKTRLNTYLPLSGAAFTQGSVLFTDANGRLAQDNANLFWDDSNNRLGIGIATPDQTLHVWRGSAGSIAAYADSGIVIEDDTNLYLSFLTPNSVNSGILFGDPENNSAGQIQYTQASDAFYFVTNGSEKVRINSSGVLLIGDTTSHGNITQGLVANQNTNSDLIVSLKATGSVATGLTTGTISYDVETDDFLVVGQSASAAGGILLEILQEVSSGDPLYIQTYSGAPGITDTTASLAAQNFFVALHDGANGLSDMAADSNGFAWGEIDSGGSRVTRMLLKADDGELHLGNATPVALDGEDDIAHVRGLQIIQSKGKGIKWTPFDDNRLMKHEDLQRIGVVGAKDERGDYLIRVQPYLALHDGAIWQLYLGLQEEREARLALEQKVKALEAS